MGWLDNMPGVRDVVYGIVTMPRRAKLKFTGAGVTVTDDGSQCVVTIPGGGGGGGGGFTESEVTDTVSTTLDNYNPTGWADCTSLVLTGTGTINGFAAPGAGKPFFRRVIVVDASSVVTIAHQAASSSSANRVECPNTFDSSLNYDVVMTRGSSAWLAYNTAKARWQVITLSGRDRYQSVPMFLSGTAVLGNGSWLGSDNVTLAAGGPGPYILQGLVAPMLNSGARGTVKLVRFAIAVTIRHEDGTVGTATSRINITTGADWAAASGDFALLSYDLSLGRWVMHPLKTSATPIPGTTSTTARTFAANTTSVWNGSATPTITHTAGSAVNGVEEVIQFPASTLTTLTLSSDLDPTGTVTYTFDDALASYLLHMKYIGAGPCIVSTLRKVTDLTP